MCVCVCVCVCRCADVAAVERWGLGLRQLVSAASVPGRPVHAVLKPLCSLTAHHALLRVYTPHALSRTAQAQTLPPLHASPLVLRQQRPFHAQRPSSPIPRFHAYTLMRPYTHAREGTHAHPRWYAEVSAPACFRARAPTSKRFMSMPKHSPPPTEACMTCMQPLGCTADPRSTFPPTLLVTHTTTGEHGRSRQVHALYMVRVRGGRGAPQTRSSVALPLQCTHANTRNDCGEQGRAAAGLYSMWCMLVAAREHSTPAAVLHSHYNAHMG